ncbi:MAG: nucleotidyltransferase domain-containing protein [Sulfurovum sp.]|nr:nucleotidyltransferase domain-containing protein [Sulfurovum sp.]
MKLTKEKILDYLKELKPELEASGIQKLALFGSFASNHQNVYSDIDIAIQKKKDFLDDYSAYDYFALLNTIKSKILKNLHTNVDIFDLDSKSSFKKEIEKELIYV